jgi:hypothetical protein
MYEYSCDICGAKKSREDRDGLWFTAASYQSNKQLTIFRWPTGRDLAEPHTFLFHICDKSTCLHELIRKFEDQMI